MLVCYLYCLCHSGDQIECFLSLWKTLDICSNAASWRFSISLHQFLLQQHPSSPASAADYHNTHSVIICGAFHLWLSFMPILGVFHKTWQLSQPLVSTAILGYWDDVLIQMAWCGKLVELSPAGKDCVSVRWILPSWSIFMLNQVKSSSPWWSDVTEWYTYIYSACYL